MGEPQHQEQPLLCYYSVQFSSVVQLCPDLCDPMNHRTPGLPVHHQLPESTQTHVHWVGDAIQPSHSLLYPSPPALNLSQHQGLFQWVSSSHQMAKYWCFSFNISPSNEHPGLISFRMDLLDLLAVQGTLKSLLQHHSSLQHRTLLLSPVPFTTGCCFCFDSIPSLFLELFLHWSPVAYWALTDLGSSSFSALSFCLL